ncbi:hypothetical protein [Escherichia coli]|uniref:hypothetical protein n=1 Tax=Escherichia coli TaxID=562 RepID=UPI0039884DC0
MIVIWHFKKGSAHITLKKSKNTRWQNDIVESHYPEMFHLRHEDGSWFSSSLLRCPLMQNYLPAFVWVTHLSNTYKLLKPDELVPIFDPGDFRQNNEHWKKYVLFANK